MDDFGATVRVLLNSLAFFLLLVLGGYVISYNPIWGFIVVFSAFDQLEDVYFYVTKNRLIPAWFRPIDIMLEGVLALVGASMFVFGLVYWYSFDSWFFLLWLIVSAMIAWSAVEDIVEGIYVIKERMKGATVASVRSISNYKFFRKLG
ncbi:MAG: hypothetical protein DRO11_10375 [Methanobacteriota archaeon]|nr:MAG: hypothetical protein DRO11_10375 [Euryarchaeota archaeon]